ncbi:antitermination protein [Pantoea ananatis]|uniref:antitermination protein Q n=1 Tax=Pantoea ananas TaxID=553 RepID=UPI001B305AC5|nr:antitermination protein [Pantoea ananatis]
MNLESTIKFFAPKSPTFSDSPRATASDSLDISDVMASFGLTGAQARFGFELFLSKHGITSSDRAVEMLTEFGLSKAGLFRAVAELEENIKCEFVQLLATFAYQDYTRSAASKRPCPCCKGSGFKDAVVFTNKTFYPDGKPPKWARVTKGVFPSYWEETRAKRETLRILCETCNGKGEISNACRCHGKGKVIDKEQSEQQGVPVTKDCPKCTGRGYARLPGEVVRRAVGYAVMTISEPTWRRNFKPFYETLITQCHKEESLAGELLQHVTGNSEINRMKQ